jgi:hypothetical protein
VLFSLAFKPLEPFSTQPLQLLHLPHLHLQMDHIHQVNLHHLQQITVELL